MYVCMYVCMCVCIYIYIYIYIYTVWLQRRDPSGADLFFPTGVAESLAGNPKNSRSHAVDRVSARSTERESGFRLLSRRLAVQPMRAVSIRATVDPGPAKLCGMEG